MIYEYERACAEAGLSEERTAAIRRVFDADKKQLRRRNEAMERNQIQILSLDGMLSVQEGIRRLEIPDPREGPEEEVIRRMDLEQLNQALEKLPQEDRMLLRLYYSRSAYADTWVSRELGIPRQTLQGRMRRLLETVRKMFFEENT